MPKTAANTNTAAPVLGNDLVWGTRDIGREIGRSERQAFHLCASGVLPATRIGGRWVTSRAKLRQHIEALLEGAAA